MANRTKVYKSQRNRVFKRDGMRCHYCKLTVSRDVTQEHPRHATLDHMTPLARGGSQTDDNLVCACRKCNGVKGNMPYEAYLWYRHMVVLGEQPEVLLAAIAIVFGEVCSWYGFYAARRRTFGEKLMALNHSDLTRLSLRPGMHGAHCSECDYLFDAYEVPASIDDVLMRMKTLHCPKCESREHLYLLMPHRYVEMVEAQVLAAQKREAVRKTADKYIPRVP